MKQTPHQPLEQNPDSIIPLLQKLIPILLVCVVASYVGYKMHKATQPAEVGLYNYDDLGKVPVSKNGRVKPFDSVARNALLNISGKSSLVNDMLLPGETESRPATVWLAELMASRPEALQRKVIRIDDPDVLGLIDKTPEDGQHFALGEFMNPLAPGEEPVYFEVGRLAQAADQKRDDLRTSFEEQIIGLARKLSLMGQLRAMTTPFVIPPVEEGQEWQPILESPNAGVTAAAREREPAKTWLAMKSAFNQGDHEAFNAALAQHLEHKQGFVPDESKKAAFEQSFNRFRPFFLTGFVYVAAGLLGLFSLLLRPLLPHGWYVSLWRSGIGMLVLGFAIHTGAMIVRIWLQGRPPVTNLYSSAVFVGWGIVGGAIILEKFTKLGVAALAASVCGVSTIIVAHQLSLDGDTMGVMVAVLDSNFWLGTHVITITLGYSATFLAGFLALCYIFFGMATPILDRQAARALTGMVYAVICFALLFSFVGTVLGGIWADQSWGRFWGWDPKENGAILIVLINAIILHARWGHLVKERGIMVLALGGNIVTIWSWFGTNLLGVGLHSYGFMDGAMVTIAIISGLHLLVMAVALAVPTNYWVSFRKPKRPGKTQTTQQPLAKAAPSGG